MAKQTRVILIDDLDGSEASESLRFALDGIEYELDLSEDNAQALRGSLERYIKAARRVGGRRQRGSAQRSSNGGGKSDARAIRVWAHEKGIEVPERGRIPADIREQYEAASR